MPKNKVITCEFFKIIFKIIFSTLSGIFLYYSCLPSYNSIAPDIVKKVHLILKNNL